MKRVSSVPMSQTGSSRTRYSRPAAAKRKFYGKRSVPQRAALVKVKGVKPAPSIVWNQGATTIVRAVKSLRGSQIAAGSSLVPASCVFNLTSMPDLTALASLYRQYKWHKMVFTYKLETIDATDDDITPTMYFRHYYDLTAATPPTLAGLLAYPDVKSHCFTRENPEVQFVVYPKQAVPVYIDTAGTTVGTAFAPALEQPRWTDMSMDGVQMYGYTYIIPVLATGQVISVTWEYHVDFKDPY